MMLKAIYIFYSLLITVKSAYNFFMNGDVL